MTLSTRLRRSVSLAAIAAVAGTAALAGSASAATFEKAPVLTPGATIPVDFPGYKEPASNKLPANYRIVVVRAAVARGEKPSTIVTAPKGFKLVTFAFSDDARRIGGRSENDYVGKRSVRLTLFVNRNEVAPGQTAHGTIYALARRGS
jgi:hypothetical protein